MKPARCRSLVAVSLALVVALVAQSRLTIADVTLSAIFGENMVLQRDTAVPVWGWAGAGERVTVTFAGQAKTATADAKGKWLVKLDPIPASAEPRTLEVSGSIQNPKSKIQNVLVGEVWLCSGQSNMAWTVSSSKDFDQEKATANFPLVRMFREDSGPNPTAQERCSGRWSVCSPDTVGGFSATAYFFGREVHQKLAVPVGLINSSVGGTPIESWTSREVMQGKPEFAPLFERWEKAQAAWDPAKAQASFEKQTADWKVALEKAKAEGKQPPRQPLKPGEPRLNTHNPGNLFNGKIAPLVPYAIRGAIWYQGESNAGTPALYATQLPLMIKDWRTRWGQGDFPFAWVQLPNFRKRTDDPGAPSSWAILREGMLKTLSVPNTGMAITIDVGEENDIHPKNKQDVGKRLGLWALAKVYGQKVAASGPLLAGHKVSGSEVTVSFTHADGGLMAKGGELKGFAIAGADKKWRWASAKIVGNTVVVSSADVKEPAAVRYAWAENPDCNLYNGAGLPASPFRTDDWQ